MIVIAIPTNGLRHDTLQATKDAWVRHTCQPITFHVTTYGDTWAAGLNDAWKTHPDADVFVCASDDMFPEDDFWLPPAVSHLDKNECPVPTVLDPRMTTHGGTQDTYWEGEVTEGAPARMTNFPILKREWLDKVFPLPEDLHYFSDNLIGDRLKAAGIPLVTCLDIRIRHAWDQRGRNESERMQADRKRYKALA